MAVVTLHRETLSRERLRRSSARWHDATSGGKTYVLPPGEQPPAHLNMPGEVREIIAASDTGCVLLWSLAESRLVVPPFPVRRREELSGWHTGPVQSILDRPRRTAVFLLRLGGYAIGVFEGERLVQSKVGSRFVKGRHRAGGSSSGRFARRRENQARDLYDEACQELRTQLEPVQKTLEHFVMGGDRHTLQAFEKRCAFLSTLRRIRQDRVILAPEPRQRVLEDAVRLLYSTQVITFRPETPGFGSPR